jgi:hypothetical protein
MGCYLLAHRGLAANLRKPHSPHRINDPLRARRASVREEPQRTEAVAAATGGVILSNNSQWAEEVTAQINEATEGKTVKSFQIDDSGMDNFVVITFEDGSQLRIQYDHIYEAEIMEKP